MNASRRARKRDKHIRSGVHSSDDHALLHVQAAVTGAGARAQHAGAGELPGVPYQAGRVGPEPGREIPVQGGIVKGPYPWLKLGQRAELERRPVERNE